MELSKRRQAAGVGDFVANLNSSLPIEGSFTDSL